MTSILQSGAMLNQTPNHFDKSQLITSERILGTEIGKSKLEPESITYPIGTFFLGE